MSGQLPLFDADRAREEAVAGMRLALQADRVGLWKVEAAIWLDRLPSGRVFTADDMIREIGVPGEGPNRNNVVGAVFSAASKQGRIRFAGRMRKSARVTRHGNVQRVWVKR